MTGCDGCGVCGFMSARILLGVRVSLMLGCFGILNVECHGCEGAGQGGALSRGLDA